MHDAGPSFAKIFSFLSADRRGDRVPAGRDPRRRLLQDPDGDGSSQNFLRHEDGDRVAHQARVREGAAGAIIAERHSRLHRRGGECDYKNASRAKERARARASFNFRANLIKSLITKPPAETRAAQKLIAMRARVGT